MVSSNTRRSVAMKPRFNGIPRAIRGWPARWRPAWPVTVTANLHSGRPECAPACTQLREQVLNGERPGVMATTRAPARPKTLRESEETPLGGRNQPTDARTAPPSAGRLAPTANGVVKNRERTHRCRSPTPAAENRPLRAPRTSPHRPACAAKAPNRPKQPPASTSTPQIDAASRPPPHHQQPLLAPRRQQRPRLPPPRPPISVIDSLILRPES